MPNAYEIADYSGLLSLLGPRPICSSFRGGDLFLHVRRQFFVGTGEVGLIHDIVAPIYRFGPVPGDFHGNAPGHTGPFEISGPNGACAPMSANQKPPEQLEKRLARVAREQGIDQERFAAIEQRFREIIQELGGVATGMMMEIGGSFPGIIE
jgi:hypothetical protein